MATRIAYVCLLAVLACTFIQESAAHRRVRRGIWDRLLCPGGNVEDRNDGQYCCYTKILKECTRITTGGLASRLWALQAFQDEAANPCGKEEVVKKLDGIPHCCDKRGNCQRIRDEVPTPVNPPVGNTKCQVVGKKICCPGLGCRDIIRDTDNEKQNAEPVCPPEQKLNYLNGEPHCCRDKICTAVKGVHSIKKADDSILGPILCPGDGWPVLGGRSRCIKTTRILDERTCSKPPITIGGMRFCCVKNNGNICESMDHRTEADKIVMEKVPCPPEEQKNTRVVNGESFCCKGQACPLIPL